MRRKQNVLSVFRKAANHFPAQSRGSCSVTPLISIMAPKIRHCLDARIRTVRALVLGLIPPPQEIVFALVFGLGLRNAVQARLGRALTPMRELAEGFPLYARGGVGVG